jgi:hypothetical protein
MLRRTDPPLPTHAPDVQPLVIFPFYQSFIRDSELPTPIWTSEISIKKQISAAFAYFWYRVALGHKKTRPDEIGKHQRTVE